MWTMDIARKGGGSSELQSAGVVRNIRKLFNIQMDYG